MDRSYASSKHPGPLDVLDLAAVWLARARWRKHDSNPQFYDAFFDASHIEKYTGDVRHIWRYGVVRRLFDELFPDSDVRVVDVGTGIGVSLLYFPRSVRFVGLEYSANSLSLARRAHPGRDAFVQAGFPHLPLASGAADFSICLEVVEHIADDQQAIRELHRILKPGGYLLISVPNTYYWPEYMSLIGHYRHYSGPGLRHQLQEAGFVVERQITQFTGLWQKYHYLYLLFRSWEFVVKKTVRPRYVVYRSHLYRWLAKWIIARLERRFREDDPRSTFILCRKAPEGMTGTCASS